MGLTELCLRDGLRDRAHCVLPTRSITLHHRIRQAPNPYSSEIKAFDTRLQSGELFSREDLVL